MLALCATQIVRDVTILKQEDRLVLEARAPVAGPLQPRASSSGDREAERGV
jgi:hypothetical protein